MAPAKRKAEVLDQVPAPIASESKKKKQPIEKTATSSRPKRTSLSEADPPKSIRRSVSGSGPRAPVQVRTRPQPAKAAGGSGSQAPVQGTTRPKPTQAAAPFTTKTEATRGSRRESKVPTIPNGALQAETGDHPSFSVDVPAKIDDVDENTDEPSYWLMKAEPDSRIEKGKDVKFSIDDLKAATSPEPWDGVRNPSARNNMRLMMKGDMAFFYHSNCKVPGIVGVMEIVQEHSIDESAFDPTHPYFDPKSDREKPKWCVVHVEYRQKFPEIIKLKDLQSYAKPGGVLESLQTLKMSRLSVSKVSKTEWDFIMGLVDSDDIAAASAQHTP